MNAALRFIDKTQACCTAWYWEWSDFDSWRRDHATGWNGNLVYECMRIWFWNTAEANIALTDVFNAFRHSLQISAGVVPKIR